MKWKATPKKPFIIGDRKEVIKFAWVPVRISNMWIWMEKYICIYEYKQKFNITGSLSEKKWIRVFNAYLDYDHKKIKIDKNI